jgi:arginine repressor
MLMRKRNFHSSCVAEAKGNSLNKLIKLNVDRNSKKEERKTKLDKNFKAVEQTSISTMISNFLTRCKKKENRKYYKLSELL